MASKAGPIQHPQRNYFFQVVPTTLKGGEEH